MVIVIKGTGIKDCQYPFGSRTALLQSFRCYSCWLCTIYLRFNHKTPPFYGL